MVKPKRPLLPLQTRINIFIFNTVMDAARRSDGSINRRLITLATFFGLRKPPNGKPRNGVKTYDITVDPSRNLWFRLFIPTVASTDSKLPVVIFFHGGGFVFLSPDLKPYDEVCRRFAREFPAVVVSVNYRLAPEHRCPAPYDDGFDVLKFLDDQTHVLPENADIKSCFLAGDSAGGNLAHHVAKRVCESSSKFNHLKVLGLIAIQPFFGGEGRTNSEMELAGVDPVVSFSLSDRMWKTFMPPGTDRDHEVVNVSGPRAADISELDFPTTMVVIGGFDSLKDWQMRYYQWLKKSGKEAYLIEYPNMIHAFYVFPEIPESGHFINEAKNFINKQTQTLM